MAVRRLNATARPSNSSASNWGLTEADFDIEYVGATLGTWEANGYNDSDFYALVWDGEALRGIEYATTRGWTYANGAEADATDEVKAAAAGWLAARDIESWNRATAHDALLVTGERGQGVEVIKGRKVPIGTTGHVLKSGENRYGTWVLFKDGDGETHITAVTNLARTDAAESLTSVEEIVETTVNRCTRLRDRLAERLGQRLPLPRRRAGQPLLGRRGRDRRAADRDRPPGDRRGRRAPGPGRTGRYHACHGRRHGRVHHGG